MSNIDEYMQRLIEEINRLTTEKYYYDLGDEAPIIYMQGKCYYLAKALQKVIPGSSLYIDKENFHIVLKVGDHYYDANLTDNQKLKNLKPFTETGEDKSYLNYFTNKYDDKYLVPLLDQIVNEAINNINIKNKRR